MEEDYSNSDNSIMEEVELTVKEAEILQYICRGFTSNDIAVKQLKEVETIDTIISMLLLKTFSKNIINLILFAIKNRLVEI